MSKEAFPNEMQAVGFEITPYLAVEKYDALEQELRGFFRPPEPFPGVYTIGSGVRAESASRSTPQLAVGEDGPYLKFMIFRDDSGPYSPQMTAFWSEVSDKTPELKDFNKQPLPYEHVKRGFFETGSAYFRGDKLESDDWQGAVGTLAKLEQSVEEFKKLAFSLTPEQARSLEFPDRLVKTLERKQRIDAIVRRIRQRKIFRRIS